MSLLRRAGGARKGQLRGAQQAQGPLGEEYQKAAQKLPDEVGTGGKAPPKDNKPAGGGSEFEEFN